MTACARSARRRSRRAQQAAFAVEAQRHLGDQHEVDIGRRERGVAGDEARVAPHQLHEADAVARAHRLDVRAADRLHRRREGALEAEAAVDEVDVVVDRLRDPDHRDRQLRAARSPRRSARAAQRAVTTDHEQHADAESARACRPSRPGPGCRAMCRAQFRPAGGSPPPAPGRGAPARGRGARPSLRSRSGSRRCRFTP